jgi:hypothetical protein
MSVYRSSCPIGFEINIEGLDTTVENLDEDLGRFVMKTVDSHFDLVRTTNPIPSSAMRR